MNIDTDLRARPAAFATYFFLGLGFLGVFFGITAAKFDWPVYHSDGLGFASIFGAIGFSIGSAFFIRRREQFKIYGAHKK